MINEYEKVKYLAILEKCKLRRLNICPQKELPEFLGVSLSTIKNFESGKLFDFWLLCRYANFCGYKMEFGIDLQILER